jgi:hypothetical protein
MLPSENGGGGVEDVKDALSLELSERVDAVCELGVIVVASASNQVIGGEGTAEAYACVQQRGAREALPPRVPRSIANDRGGVREPLALLIGEHCIQGGIGERDAEPRSPLPGSLLGSRLIRRQRVKASEIALLVDFEAPLGLGNLRPVERVDGDGERGRVELNDDGCVTKLGAERTGN